MRFVCLLFFLLLPCRALCQTEDGFKSSGTAVDLLAEVDSIASAIRCNYVDPLRGTTREQWDSVLTAIKTNILNGHRFKEDYLWQLRNFSIVINDGHLWFPDGGFLRIIAFSW